MAVCHIGTTDYETLDAALAAVTAGQTIVLDDDCTGTGTTLAAVTVGFTLDYNGKTVTWDLSGDDGVGVMKDTYNPVDPPTDGKAIADAIECQLMPKNPSKLAEVTSYVRNYVQQVGLDYTPSMAEVVLSKVLALFDDLAQGRNARLAPNADIIKNLIDRTLTEAEG